MDGQDCSGGMGPADFVDEWSDADNAIKDILDFFFGEPVRMNRKADEKEEQEIRREARKQATSDPRG